MRRFMNISYYSLKNISSGLKFVKNVRLLFWKNLYYRNEGENRIKTLKKRCSGNNRQKNTARERAVRDAYLVT